MNGQAYNNFSILEQVGTKTITAQDYANLPASEKAKKILYYVTNDSSDATLATSDSVLALQSQVASDIASSETTTRGLISTTNRATRQMIATVETSATASKAYAVDDLLIRDDLSTMYKVTSPIASGGTITPGSNVAPTSVADLLGNSSSSSTELITVTLSSSSWSNKAQTITNSAFETSGYVFVIGPDTASLEPYVECRIYADDVTVANKMTFHCDDVPDTNISVLVIKMMLSA